MNDKFRNPKINLNLILPLLTFKYILNLIQISNWFLTVYAFTLMRLFESSTNIYCGLEVQKRRKCNIVLFMITYHFFNKSILWFYGLTIKKFIIVLFLITFYIYKIRKTLSSILCSCRGCFVFNFQSCCFFLWKFGFWR